MGLTFIDVFCGAGGSSSGLTAAGLELKLGANHWDRAIETHSANFPDAEHVCADINNYDMRRLPTTDVAWFSPICTEASPAGGTSGYRRPKESQAGQLDLLQEAGYVSQQGMVRTRATFLDVIRATEVHRYLTVIVENVPDVIDRWELFDWWLDGMARLGYTYQLVSVSSAHVGSPTNPWAPQWRDRLYIVFTRRSVGRQPDLTPRPLSLCQACGDDVAGEQTWCPAARRRPMKVGRYRRIGDSNYGQYWYTCPNCKGSPRVEPYVLPASTAIDWSDLGTRIPELSEPLKPNTIARIEAGLRMFAGPVVAVVRGNTYEAPGSGYLRAWPAAGVPLTTQTCTSKDALVVPPFMVNSNHDDVRIYPTTHQPLPSRTTKIGDGICMPPMLVPSGGTWAENATSALDEPMRTRTANPKGFESLVVPEAFLAMLRRNGTATSVQDPMATVTAGGTHHALIVPYYTKGVARTAGDPMDTVSTHDRFALVSGDRPIAVDDCRYRMLRPRESLRAQRFPDAYIVHGNQGEQTMQAGNAVSANVAQWIGERVAAALDGRAA